MKEYEEISNFVLNLESSITDTKESIPLLEKANKYIIILNKYILEDVKVLKELYSEYFPELPTMITNNYDYVRSIKVIEEHKNLIKNENQAGIKQLNQELSFLPNNVLMALIFMLPSSFVLKINSEEKSLAIKNSCDKILDLFQKKTVLLNFISKNMKYLAPNLTLLLGAEIAAKLVTEAGGLSELARTPSGNILNMGRHELNLEGFSTMNRYNNGYLTELNEYKDAVDSMKIYVLRRYANKAALAARKDAFMNKSKISDKFGEKMKIEISEKVEKIKNDIQPILKKPLPRPDDKPSRKRGGKRVRGIKQKYELTRVRKLKNRMKFGEPETEYRETGKGFGMLGIGGIGSTLKLSLNKNNKIITKKQKLYDKKYATKNFEIKDSKDKK